MPLSIYAHRPYPDTPFNAGLPFSVYSDQGFVCAATASEADWIVCGRLRPILPLMLRKPRGRYLIWTNEPRHSRTLRRSVRLSGIGPRIEFMNVFAGDVYWHNLHFFAAYHFDIYSDLGIPLKTPLKHRSSEDVGDREWRRAAAVLTHRLNTRTQWVVAGRDRDLEKARVTCALVGYQRGIADVYGRGWPEGIAKTEPVPADGAASWWERKLALISRYGFCIALENTNWPYYCTEKIWHAIVGGCLPIYWGEGNRIYETFPRESFLDLASYGSPDELYDHIERMTLSEYLDRYNRCVDVFNDAQEIRRATKLLEPAEHIRRIAARIQSPLNSP